MDDGYYDMSKIMRSLVEVKVDGIMIPDHVPGLGSNPRKVPVVGEQAEHPENLELTLHLHTYSGA